MDEYFFLHEKPTKVNMNTLGEDSSLIVQQTTLAIVQYCSFKLVVVGPSVALHEKKIQKIQNPP